MDKETVNTKEELLGELQQEVAAMDEEEMGELMFALPYVLEGKLSFEEIHQLYIESKTTQKSS